jgi:nitrate/TMAO reductase-like tetraheme cytochrome c subunit
MRAIERKNDVTLPLDPTNGKVFCGTCHNVHARGVLKTAAAARGADAKQRLRMPEICGNCHEK